MATDIEKVLSRQKVEAQVLINASFVERDFSVADYIDTKIAKVIVGPRRSGKSMFALQSIKKRHFAYVNMDDEGLEALNAGSLDYNLLLRSLVAVYGKFDVLLMDEVQNLKNWQLFVNRLQREGYNIIVTGSNSNLMSTELATHLTGRYIEKTVLPFSFKEYIKTKNIKAEQHSEEGEGQLISALREYLQTGGYPELVTKGLEKSNYLKMLVDNTIYIDIVKRHGIRKQDEIRRLFAYLMDVYAKEFTYNSAAQTTEIRSVNTVKKYFGYLKEAYLLLELKRFEPKAKSRHKAPRKVYAIDTGLVNTFSLRLGEDYGRLMENAVAIELTRRLLEIRYWRDAMGKEVDFVVVSGIRISKLVQVCYDINDKKTKTREVSALEKASLELRCSDLLIITWDYEGVIKESGKRIKCIPLWKWLLGT